MLNSLFILALYLAAFTYGAFCFLRKGTPLYFKLLVFSVACFLLEKLYFVVNYLCTGAWDSMFNFAVFGTGAAFAFMLSSNYGQFDSIADDGSEGYGKYRIMAAAAPAVMGLLSAAVVLHYIRADYSAVSTAVILLVNLPGVFSSYFNMKLLIFPDTYMVKPLRACNAMALVVISVVIISEYVFSLGTEHLGIYIDILRPICLFAWMVCAERGYKRWTI